MAKKLKILVFTLALLILGAVMNGKLSAVAAPCTNPSTDSSCICSSQGCDNGKTTKKSVDCASGKVSETDSTQCVPLGNGCNGNSADTCLADNPITVRLNQIINFFSAAIAIVVIGVIILGGIQYSLAGDNATATSAAKQRIINGVIALVAFIFTFAILQWLVPGGL